MTNEDIARLLQRRAELKKIAIEANERLDYVSSETLENNLTCDHKYPDNRWAESNESGVCAICGCGMGYQHYLELNEKP
jgi:hypothetical protein